MDLMGITCSSTKQEFDKIVAQITEIIREEIINTLAYLGEQCNIRIKDRSAEESWIDHTGNLRSSIGYAVFDHGKETIESVFTQVLEGTEGTAEGKKYVESLASLYATTYALVVVAGMSYADYVEAIDGKDVLASTEIWAKAKVGEYLNNAKEKAENKINRLLL